MWTVRQVWEYLVFYFRAVTPRKLHSPFLYHLLTHAFDDGKGYYIFDEIEDVRDALLRSTNEVREPSFGAGTRASRREGRSVGEIAGRALSSPRKCEVLFRLVEMLRPEMSLELGSSVGISLAYLAGAFRAGQVIGLEGNPHLAHIAHNVLAELELTNGQVVEGRFEDSLQDTLEKYGPLDFVYLDGDHREEATIRNYKAIRKHMSKNSVLILDDIRWSPGMYNAWKQIGRDSDIKVAIDAFQMAIFFFSPRFQDRLDLRITPRRIKGGPIIR